jgi:flavin reductase (DIM6/NTAB) family NADH-FMN oxidoreductase RutF
MNNFLKINPEEISDNVFKLLGTDWMLISAGNEEKFNTMTASWGALGMLWNKPVAICFVRPQRYTFEFINKSETFSLSFFGEQYREALNICGTLSGRNVNKVEKAGLEPVFDSNGSVYYKQASLVLCCKKLYSDFIKPSEILDPHIHSLYPKNDYHKLYIGEITDCLKSK